MTYLPTRLALQLAQGLPWGRTIYDVVADVRALHPHLAAPEDLLLASVDQVTTASHTLAERYAARANRPVGHILDGFVAPLSAGSEAPPPRNRPLAVCLGGLNARVDLECLHALAEDRPQWDLFILGTVSVRVPNWFSRTNIQVRPPVARHHDLWPVLRGCSVGLVPYTRDAYVDGMHPAKLMEGYVRTAGCRSTRPEGDPAVDGSTHFNYGPLLTAFSLGAGLPPLSWQAEYEAWQRRFCWCHKMLNVLDKLPQRLQPEAETLVRDIYTAPTREKARERIVHFAQRFDGSILGPWRPSWTIQQELLTYYDFPREHRKSLRTSNPIESTFDPVRLRTRATRRMRAARTGLYLVFQLVRRAERRWRRIDAPHLVTKVLDGIPFMNGVEVTKGSKRRVVA